MAENAATDMAGTAQKTKLGHQFSRLGFYGPQPRGLCENHHSNFSTPEGSGKFLQGFNQVQDPIADSLVVHPFISFDQP